MEGIQSKGSTISDGIQEMKQYKMYKNEENIRNTKGTWIIQITNTCKT